MEPLWDRLRSEWKRQGLTIRTGAHATRFAEFERRHAVRLPQDLREYLGSVDGLEPFEYAAGVVRFWPLEEIKSASEFASYPWFGRFGPLFAFGDYAVDACVWAIELHPAPSGANRIITVGCKDGEENEIIARSVTEFFELYLKDLSCII
jgi:cell wall assembly regulator SMI1